MILSVGVECETRSERRSSYVGTPGWYADILFVTNENSGFRAVDLVGARLGRWRQKVGSVPQRETQSAKRKRLAFFENRIFSPEAMRVLRITHEYFNRTGWSLSSQPVSPIRGRKVGSLLADP